MPIRRPSSPLLVMAALTMTAALGACLLAPRPALADKESVRLIVNDPSGRKKPEDKCDVAACTSLLEAIEGAKVSIDFAIYGMRNQSEILKALRDAKLRGVRIRGVVDRDGENKNYYSSTDAMAVALGDIRGDYQAELQMARRAEDKRFDENTSGKSSARPKACEPPDGFLGPLQCLGYDLGDRCLLAAQASREEIDNPGAIMHHKFFVVDGKLVWTGSTNVSDSGTGGYNGNVVLVIASEKVASWYTREFTTMYVDDKYHDFKPSQGEMKTTVAKMPVQVLFSPQDTPIETGLRPLLQHARKTIDIGIFFLTHKEITGDLIDAHQRGVKVRVVMDATAAGNGYAKHELLRAAGIPVKIENWGGKMHMKAAVIDGKTLIAGSMNWTSAGEGGNDENTVIIEDRKLAAEFLRAYDRIWKSIPDTRLQGRPDPESLNSGTACFDGVDDDFDKLADAADPGCSPTPPALPALAPWTIVQKEEGHSLFKGLTKGVDKLYYAPWHRSYEDMIAEEFLCSEQEAWQRGYRPASRR